MEKGFLKSSLFAGLSLLAMADAAMARANTSEAEMAPASAPADATAPESDEIVVTARRVEERLQDVPIAVTAISAAEIEARGIRSLTDVQVPNLFLLGTGQEPQAALVTIRGQGNPSVVLTASPSVGVYIDGVNYPRALGLRANLVDLSRIEVLRGPQGTLFGRNTTGGAINYVTQQATDEFSGSVRARYGNYDYYDLLGILNLPLADGHALRFAAERSRSDGFGRNGLGERMSGEDNIFLRGQLRSNWSDTFETRIVVDWQDSETNGAIGRLVGLRPALSPMLPEGAPAVFEVAAAAQLPLPAALELLRSFIGGSPFRSFGTSPQFSDFESHGVSLFGDLTLSDSVMLRSISAYRRIDRRNAVDVDYTPFRFIESDLESFSKFFSQEVQLIGNFDRLDWVLGGFVSRESGTEFTTTFTLPTINPANPLITDFSVVNESYAFFGQANWQIAERVELTGGLRWTNESQEVEVRNINAGVCTIPPPLRDPGLPCQRSRERTDDGVTFLLSVNYKLVDDVMLYASVSRGFVGGGFNTRAGTGEAAFEPETANTYEIGLKSELFDRKVVLNGAIFYTDYKNIQREATIATETTGVSRLVTNAATAEIYGGEIELTIKPTASFTISGNAGYTRGKYKRFEDLLGDRSDEPWPQPRLTYGVSANYNLDLADDGAVAFQVTVRGQSEVDLQPPAVFDIFTRQSGFALVDGRISYTLPNRPVEVALFGRNLTDKHFMTNASAFDAPNSLGFTQAEFGPPRTYGVELIVRFDG